MISQNIDRFVCGLPMMFLLCAFATTVPVNAAEDPEVDLPYVIERLQQWRGSFVSLHVSWEQRDLSNSTNQPLTEWTLPEDWQNARLLRRFDWVWGEFGMEVLDQKSFLDSEGGSKRTLDVFNADKGIKYHALYEHPESEEESLTRLTILPVWTVKPVSMIPRYPFQGLYWNGTAAWLPEVLASSLTWKIDGTELVHDSLCVRIVRQPNGTETLWLDIEHEYLVRRYHASQSFDYLVDDFQQVPSGIWIPARGRLQLMTSPIENSVWNVTNARVNQPLNDSRLGSPAPEVGTIVNDSAPKIDEMPITLAPTARGEGERIRGSRNPSSREKDEPLSTKWIWWTIGISIVVTIVMFRNTRT